MDKQEKNPLTHGTAIQMSEGLENEIDQLPGRVDRYGKAKARSKEMQAFLCDQELYRSEYLKLKNCGNWLLFHFYYTISKVRLHSVCLCRKHLICPLCAILRASKYMRAYLERFLYLRSQFPGLYVSMVTLTVKNGSSLTERDSHLRNCYKKLEQSRRDTKRGQYKSEWGKVLGLVGTYEYTNTGNGWHPHMHILILHREKIYHGSLAKQFSGISGDSNIIDIRPLSNPDNPAKDFVEVFKYSLKFSELSLEDNIHAYEKLSGKKLLFSAGLFWGVKLPENWEDEPFDQADLPFIEILYNYMDNVGYSMAGMKNGDLTAVKKPKNPFDHSKENCCTDVEKLFERVDAHEVEQIVKKTVVA